MEPDWPDRWNKTGFGRMARGAGKLFSHNHLPQPNSVGLWGGLSNRTNPLMWVFDCGLLLLTLTCTALWSQWIWIWMDGYPANIGGICIYIYISVYDVLYARSHVELCMYRDRWHALLVNLAWWCHIATWNLFNIGSGNSLLPDGTNPLPEPMLTYHQQGFVAFTWGQSHWKCTRYSYPWYEFEYYDD